MQRFHKLILAVGWCLFWGGTLSPGWALSLEDAETKMEKSALHYQACQLDAKVLIAQAQAEAQLRNPNLDLLTEDLAGSAFASDQNYHQWTLSLQQALPLTQRREIQTQLGLSEAQASLARCQVKLREAKWALAQDYLKALSAQEQLGFMRQRTRLLKEILGSLDREIALGRLAAMSRYLPASEAERSLALTQQAEQNWELAQAQLSAYWQGEISEVEDLHWPSMPLTSEGHPLAEQVKKEQESAHLAIALAQSSQLPDLVLGSGLRWHPQSQDWGINAQIGWEIPLWNQGLASIKRAEYRAEQLALEHREALRQLNLKRTQIQQQLISREQQWQVYERQLIPAAQDYLKQVQVGLQQGRFTISQWLEARRQTVILEQEMLEAKTETFLLKVQLQLLSP